MALSNDKRFKPNVVVLPLRHPQDNDFFNRCRNAGKALKLHIWSKTSLANKNLQLVKTKV